MSSENQNIYFDESVNSNKLLELQDPSESHSFFNQQNLNAQINDVLAEDDEATENSHYERGKSIE
jgi:hypothetical protein